MDPWGWATRPNNGKYHIFHDHQVDPSNRYASDAVQFRQANKELFNRMQVDPAYRRTMMKKSPALATWTPNGSSPPGFTWHHHEDINRLVLVDRNDHRRNHRLYHPTGKGGRDIWGGGEKGRQGLLNGKTGKPITGAKRC